VPRLTETNPWLTRPIRPERPVLASSPMCLGGMEVAVAQPPHRKTEVFFPENQWLKDDSFPEMGQPRCLDSSKLSELLDSGSLR